ncbi:MAG: protoporphyrinogen/coproporphyrinogen oxidase [Rhodoglobus sp.]
MADTPDFTVIGGGIGGLVIARRLAMAGRSVNLLEASDRLGGTVARQTVGNIDLDAGAESFATRGGTVAALATELGLGSEIVSPDGDGAWLQPVTGDAVPLPAVGVLGIPSAPLAADVIRVVGMSAALRAQLDSLIPALWWSKSLTLGGLVRRRMGRGMLDKLVTPVVHGVYSMHPDQLALDRVAGLRATLMMQGSLTAAVRKMRASAPSGAAVQGIRGGINRLVTELEADLDTYGVDVTLGRRVESLDDLPGTVIVAAPGITAPLDGRRVVLVTLVLDDPALDAAPRGTGVLVAPGASSVMARALTHSTVKWEWLRERTGGKHVVRLSYDADPSDPVGQAVKDASRLLGVRLDPSSVVDFARVEWVRPAASTAPEGIAVVGETVGGSGIAGIVAHAEAKAAELLAAPAS